LFRPPLGSCSRDRAEYPLQPATAIIARRISAGALS